MRSWGNPIKIFPALLMLGFFLVSLTACGGGQETPQEEEPETQIDLSSVTERLLTEVPYEEELVPVAPEVFFDLFGVAEEDVAEQYNYFSGGATAEEIVVMKAVGREALDRLVKAAENRIAYQKDIYASYAPEEVVRLNNAVLLTEGDSLFLCISADSDKAREVIQEELDS
ncbi:MAG: DUF4358 domain-containing protein [Peptococcaceae bacterium]|nr:DUF4358 domain-containing protein [Peptococcaceae bacterium]